MHIYEHGKHGVHIGLEKSHVGLLQSSGNCIYLRQADVSPLFIPFPV